MIRKLLIIGLISGYAFAQGVVIGGREFSKVQIENFKMAYTYGKMIGYEKELMGILNTESDAIPTSVGDKVNKPFKRSYGVMQVKLGTYYWTKKSGYITPLDDQANLTEEEVLYHLMKDRNFNIYVAAGHFKMLTNLCKTVDKAISGYNRGHCNEDEKGKKYRNKVKKFMVYMEKTDFVKRIEEMILEDKGILSKKESLVFDTKQQAIDTPKLAQNNSESEGRHYEGVKTKKEDYKNIENTLTKIENIESYKYGVRLVDNDGIVNKIEKVLGGYSPSTDAYYSKPAYDGKYEYNTIELAKKIKN